MGKTQDVNVQNVDLLFVDTQIVSYVCARIGFTIFLIRVQYPKV